MTDDSMRMARLKNFIEGYMATPEGKQVQRAALAFAELETALEEMLPPSDEHMQQISRLLEHASLLFGKGITLRAELAKVPR